MHPTTWFRESEQMVASWLRTLAPFIFLISIIVGLIILLGSLFHVGPNLANSDKVTLFVGILAGAVVWWQGHLITRQIELQAVLDLHNEWNSEEMRRKRSATWSHDKPDLDSVEDVLEFLEKVSTLEKEKYISCGIIWDTFGWYLWRYYFYCKEIIPELRNKWTPLRTDHTLYQDLEELYPKLRRMEVRNRNEKRGLELTKLTEGDVEKELQETKNKFIRSEGGQAHG